VKTRTPGLMYVVAQIHANDLKWMVTTVSGAQGLAMKRRGVPHVYFTSAEAHTMRNKLQRKRKAQRELFEDAELVREDPYAELRADIEKNIRPETVAKIMESHSRPAGRSRPESIPPGGPGPGVLITPPLEGPLFSANHDRTVGIIRDALNKEKL